MNEKNGNAVILPAIQMPESGTKLRMSVQNGLLTLEFPKSCDFLQFNHRDAIAFVKGLVAHVNSMQSH